MHNTTFFDIMDSEEKAYWLGFIYADGYLYKNAKQVSITLGRRDAGHLAKIAELFGCEVKEMKAPHKKVGKVYVSVRSVFSSKHLYQAIRDKGIPQKKSTAETAEVLEHIPDNLLHHFLRGYFDGDGHIGHTQNNEYRFVLCGSYTFLLAVSLTLSSALGIAPHQPAKVPGIYKLAWGGVWQLNKLRSWLYEDATIYLERKKRIFDEMPSQRGTSQFQGVYWNLKNKKWIARIYAVGKTRHIGCYLDEIEAALAYDQAAKHYYGVNAKLNLPAGHLTQSGSFASSSSEGASQ